MAGHRCLLFTENWSVLANKNINPIRRLSLDVKGRQSRHVWIKDDTVLLRRGGKQCWYWMTALKCVSASCKGRKTKRRLVREVWAPYFAPLRFAYPSYLLSSWNVYTSAQIPDTSPPTHLHSKCCSQWRKSYSERERLIEREREQEREGETLDSHCGKCRHNIKACETCSNAVACQNKWKIGTR